MKTVFFLALIGTCCSGIACASRRSAVAPGAKTCAEVLRSAATTDGAVVRIDADCALEVRTAAGATRSRVLLSSADTTQGQIRRIVSTSDLVFVLRSRPAALEVYELPMLTRIPVVGALGFREPTDLVVLPKDSGQSAAYILDNVRDSRFWSDADVVYEGPRVLRITLDRHRSSRRDVLIARSVDSLRASLLGGGEEQSLLDGIDVMENELRVVVIEGRRRFAEYFTLDGVLLEREPLDVSP